MRSPESGRKVGTTATTDSSTLRSLGRQREPTLKRPRATCGRITDRDLALHEEIGDHRSGLRWQLQEPKPWSGSLRRLSFAWNIHGSNSIEGFVAGLDDAAAVVARQDPISLDEATRQALVG